MDSANPFLILPIHIPEIHWGAGLKIYRKKNNAGSKVVCHCSKEMEVESR